MLFRNIEGRIFAIFKPSNANQSKVKTGQRLVTDFRHLIARIAKNKFSLSIRDTFSLLGNLRV